MEFVPQPPPPAPPHFPGALVLDRVVNNNQMDRYSQFSSPRLIWDFGFDTSIDLIMEIGTESEYIAWNKRNRNGAIIHQVTQPYGRRREKRIDENGQRNNKHIALGFVSIKNRNKFRRTLPSVVCS